MKPNRKVIQEIAKKYYQTNKIRNIVLAGAIILSTILITTVCSTFYNYMKLSTNQELREMGTTANFLITRPTLKQLDNLKNMDIVEPQLNLQYVTGSLVGNPGQAGIDINMLSVTNWERYVHPLLSNVVGNYPRESNEIMMSTWLLNRLGYQIPKIGMKMQLTVTRNSEEEEGISEAQTQTFILAGYYKDTANINSENKRIVYTAESLIADHSTEIPNLVGVQLRNSNSFQNKIDKIKNNISLAKGQDLVVIYDGRLNMSIKEIIIAFIALVFFVLDGYLIIFNVINISVSQDIRFYGLLKTLGTTTNQLKKIVYLNALKTAIYALPVGLALGYGVSSYIVPLLLSSFNNTSFMDIKFNLWVILTALATSAFTLIISCRTPAKRVGNVSPIEALLYTLPKSNEHSLISRTKMGAKIPFMALKNILRNKKRIFIVVLTIFLSNTAVIVLATFLKSFSVEEYINSEVKYDIALYNHMTRASFSPIEEQHITPELLEKLSAIDGVSKIEKTSVVSIYEKYSDKNFGEWLRISNDFRKSMNEELRDKTLYEQSPKTHFWGLLIGIDDEKLIEYNKTTNNPIDVDAFSKGEIALVTDLNGTGIPLGARIPFSLIQTDKSFEVKIGGQITFERDAMNSGAAPWLIVSNNVINKYDPNAIVYSVKINVQKNKEQSVLDAVTLLTNNDSSISRTSKIEQSSAFADFKHSFSNFSMVIICILSSIGILNFVNTILVSVIARKREIALLECVGATKSQIKKLITYEGIWYAFFSLLLTVSLGNGINYLVFTTLQGNIGYGAFSYPKISMLVCGGIVLLVCGVLPCVLYRFISHKSIIEQLRES